jgi:hypothetical protein
MILSDAVVFIGSDDEINFLSFYLGSEQESVFSLCPLELDQEKNYLLPVFPPLPSHHNSHHFIVKQIHT